MQGVGWLTSEELWWDEAGRLDDARALDLQDSHRARLAADASMWSCSPGARNREDTIYRSKAVGEPPLMLAMSVFYAIRDAIASLAGGGAAAARCARDTGADPARVRRAALATGHAVPAAAACLSGAARGLHHRLVEPAPALGAHHHRHRLDRRIVLLHLARRAAERAAAQSGARERRRAICGRCTAAASTTRRNTGSPRPSCPSRCTGSSGRPISPGSPDSRCFVVLYYLNADAYLVDPRVMDIGAGAAVAISVGLLLAGVVVYEALCRTVSGERAFTAIGAVVVLATCWGLTQVFSGRGAFMQMGAMLGTIMAANVAHVIIPSQKRLVSAKREGRALDPAPGLEAKRRSVHNNYLTLPVLLAMISPHFAFLYAHADTWAILFALFVAGALIRHWFNLRNRGRNVPAVPALALAILAGVAVAVAPLTRLTVGGPSGPIPSAQPAATFTQVRSVVQQRCAPCHSSSPTHPMTSVAAAGVAFDSPREIEAWAPRIYERAVVTRTMPLGNATNMTDAERDMLAQWFADGARTE